MAEGREEQRGREYDAAAQDDGAALPDVAEDRQERLDQVAGHVRHAQQQADLRVTQPQVIADQRPRRLPRAVSELVKEFDGKEHEDERRGAPEELTGVREKV